ncbi:MAG: autotransporter outer membrane beta-barrel domain-containing protein [Endomicrobium sp.]|jgi:hypothetical protein|nr:autotransporter outer membrane beta-barrel domain-containing protein [Endomicrobium sp.]
MVDILSCKKVLKNFLILGFFPFLYLPVQSFANQSVEVNANVENKGFGLFSFPQSIAGNGNTSNFGLEPFNNDSISGNSIVISSGIFVSGDVYGAKLLLDTTNDTSQIDMCSTANSVSICESANVNGAVYGDHVSVNLSNYQHNTASLSVEGNSVTLLGRTDNVTGGYGKLLLTASTLGSTFNLTSSNNSVNSPVYATNMRGGFSRVLTGDRVSVSHSTFNICALDNTIDAASSDFSYSGYIYVDCPLSTSCVFNAQSLNNVNISYGNAKFIYGGYIQVLSLYSNNPIFNISASNNLVSISGSVSDICCGGYIDVHANHSSNPRLTLTATNNKVILSEIANISDDCIIYGGFCKLTAGSNPSLIGSLETDTFSGNTLEIHTSGVSAYGINNFENYIFYLPQKIKNGDVIITALNGTGGAKLEYDNNRKINLTNVIISLMPVPTLIMAPGDKVILIRSGLGFEGRPKNSQSAEVAIDGLIFLGTGKFDIDVLGNDLTASLESKSAVMKPEAKSYPYGKVAAIAFLNQGSDLVSEKLISEASGTSKTGIISYGAMSVGASKYNTASYANVSGLSIAAGVGKKLKKTTLGIFCEVGNGNYKSRNEISEDRSIDAKGNCTYGGLGILAKIGLADVYFESSAKIGNSKTDYESTDIQNLSNNYPKYDYDAIYYGLHFGCGYTYKYFDLYSKYMLVYQEAKSVSLPTNETIDFDPAVSQRLRIGLKSYVLENVKTKPYFEIAYEQEFDAIIKARASDVEIENVKLTGNSWIYNTGIRFDIGNFSLDVNGQCFTGKREGFTGKLKLKYTIKN